MAEATHLLSLPLKHKMRDISDLAAELQRYLLLDGSRAMTGDFDLDGSDIMNPYQINFSGGDVCIVGNASLGGTLNVMNKALSVYRPMTLGAFTSWGESSSQFKNATGTQGFGIYPPSSILQALGSPAAVEPIWNDSNAVLNFQSWDGSQRVVSAVLGNGAKFEIKRAGDLTMLAGKKLIFDSGDYVTFDQTNNRYLFYIGDSVVGYVDSSGFHNGAP